MSKSLVNKLKNLNSGSVFMLLIASFIWGSTFVPQKTAMEVMDPMFYSALRFILGSLVVLPIALYFYARQKNIQREPDSTYYSNYKSILFSALAGFILSLAAGLQQIGLVFTNISNAAFLTSLYIIIVPILYSLNGTRINKHIYFSGFIALVGVFLLSLEEDFSLRWGDLIILLGSIFWALHIIVINIGAKNINAFIFAFWQFMSCGLFSLLFASLMQEDLDFSKAQVAINEVLYAGVLSTGMAYTLQIIGQQKVPAIFAAIIFSMEAVFATIFENIFFDFNMYLKTWLGCLLIILAVSYVNLIPYLNSKAK